MTPKYGDDRGEPRDASGAVTEPNIICFCILVMLSSLQVAADGEAFDVFAKIIDEDEDAAAFFTGGIDEAEAIVIVGVALMVRCLLLLVRGC